MSTETKPFAWYWYDATGCLFITGDDRKPDVPAEAKPLYASPPPQAHLRGITDAERLEDLRLAAKAIRTYMPETLPAGEDGKIHFARALAEDAADAIEAVLATTEGSDNG